MIHAEERNGLVVVRSPGGIGVGWADRPGADNRQFLVEVEVPQDGGTFHKKYVVGADELPFREYFGTAVDHLTVGVTVKEGMRVVAELLPLDAPPKDWPQFFKREGEQVHVTENYVSVPPALTITDEAGAVWTLGFTRAEKEQSPDGEYAFDVLRDGAKTGEIASRIERRHGKVRVFTRHGWRRWNGATFF